MVKIITLLLVFSSAVYPAFPQDTAYRLMTISDLFRLTDSNSVEMDIARKNIGIAAERLAVAKSRQLPEIATSIDAGYLSTIIALNPDFSSSKNVKTPHFTNNYFLEASETVYQGGAIRYGIRKSELAKQQAIFFFDKDRQDMKLLLLGMYLDLFKLYNDRTIYKKNIDLSQKRLSDLLKLREQGLIIGNDVIRNELQVADFKLSLDEVENNISIVNNDLTVALGLPEYTMILPDTALVSQPTPERSVSDYRLAALMNQPLLKEAAIAERIAGTNVDLEKAKRLPSLSVYAGDALQRPFLATLEPLDIYYNAYQVGIRLNYNISSLYHTRDKIKVAELEEEQQRSKTLLQKQQTEIEVNTAIIRYKEAKQRNSTLKKSLELANDNFRVVQQKYLNQLAQITDMLDASAAKLSAELELNNSEINIISQWYRLQKAAGSF